MRSVFQFEDYVVKAEKSLVVLLIFAMVGMSFTQVLLRLLLHSGIVWLDPLMRRMVVWAGLTGAALAARYCRHFALEAFVKSAPRALHRPLEILAGLFTIAASSLLFYASYKFIKDEFAAGAVAFYINRLAVSAGWSEIIMPAAFALIGFHTMLNLFRNEKAREV